MATEVIEQPHIKVRLISEHGVLSKGVDTYLGLELVPEAGWHVYWRNPGDSGMPPKIRFTAIDGVDVGEPLWPVPHKIPFGPMTNYGYEKVVLPIPISISTTQQSALIKLDAKASWLVCKDLCVPGQARLQLNVPLKPVAEISFEAKAIEQARKTVPKTMALLGGTAVAGENDNIEIQLFSEKPVFRTASTIEFFPVNEQLVDANATAEINWKQNVVNIKQLKSSDFFKIPETIAGVLVVDDQYYWEFEFAVE